MQATTGWRRARRYALGGKQQLRPRGTCRWGVRWNGGGVGSTGYLSNATNKKQEGVTSVGCHLQKKTEQCVCKNPNRGSAPHVMIPNNHGAQSTESGLSGHPAQVQPSTVHREEAAAVPTAATEEKAPSLFSPYCPPVESAIPREGPSSSC